MHEDNRSQKETIAYAAVLHAAGEIVPPEVWLAAGVIHPPENLSETRERLLAEIDHKTRLVAFIDSVLSGQPDMERLSSLGGSIIEVSTSPGEVNRNG